jgi:DeoR family transcriptional regulator of aga operon
MHAIYLLLYLFFFLSLHKKNPMVKNIAARHQLILDLLEQEQYVSVASLSEKTNTSVVTIRKDLSLLEEKGLVFRSHGSASLSNPYVSDRHIAEKEKFQADEKARIAEKAASLINEGDTILLASGTTINELARKINSPGSITVISASLVASEILCKQAEIETIQLAGMVRKTSASVVGPLAEQMLHGFTCNKLFLGVDGIDPDFGLTTTNALEASLNKKMIGASQKIIVLADASKLNRKGFGQICSLEKVDVIITDKEAPAELVVLLEDKGIEVFVV